MRSAFTCPLMVSLRFRAPHLPDFRWFIPAEKRISLPLLLTLNRLAAVFLVFSLFLGKPLISFPLESLVLRAEYHGHRPAFHNRLALNGCLVADLLYHPL